MDVMTENKVVPKLRFPSFNEGWSSSTLNCLTKLITKGTTPKFFTPEGVSFVKIQGLDGIHIRKEKCLYIDENTHFNYLKRSILKVDDILFAIAGATIGKVGVVTNDILPANTNQALAIIRLKNSNYLNYILQILQSTVMKKYIYKNISVGAQPNLSLQQINDFKFFIPSLDEQQKIAYFLSAVDEKFQQLTKKKELLEEYKKGIMQKIFSQELRFKDESGNNYPDWEEKKLGAVCNIKKGKQLNKIELTESGLYPALNGGINPSGYTDKWNTEKETITISEGGNSCGYLNLSKTRFWCGGHCYALLELQSNINFKYLFQILKFSENQIMRLRVGSSLPNIQMKEINKFLVKLPEIAEQLNIANFLSAIDRKTELVNTQIENTKAFKKGLLQQMFV